MEGGGGGWGGERRRVGREERSRTWRGEEEGRGEEKSRLWRGEEEVGGRGGAVRCELGR